MAHLMCELYYRMRVIGVADGFNIALPLTQTDLGDAVGITPVHTNRVIQELRRRKLIALGDGRLTILDLEKLEEVAAFDERDAHLEGQARTYGRDNAAPAQSEAGNRTAQQAEATRHMESLESRAERAATARTVAEAERIERQAHLEGQARTYGQRRTDTSETPATAADPEPEFLPGSRHVPTR